MENQALKKYEEYVSEGLKVHESLVDECRNQLDIYLSKRELVVGGSMMFYGDEKYCSIGSCDDERMWVIMKNGNSSDMKDLKSLGGHTLAEILGKMLTINKTLDNFKPMGKDENNEDKKQCSCSWSCAPCKHRIPPITESIYDKYQI